MTSCLCASLLVVAASVNHQLMLLAEGNDFLPALPALDIRAGAIDQLLGSYRQLLQTGVLVCPSWPRQLYSATTTLCFSSHSLSQQPLFVATATICCPN